MFDAKMGTDKEQKQQGPKRRDSEKCTGQRIHRRTSQRNILNDPDNHNGVKLPPRAKHSKENSSGP